MAKSSLQTKLRRLRKSLEDTLKIKGLKEEFYLDRVEQFLRFYTIQQHLNTRMAELLRGGPLSDRTLRELTAEARNLDKQMMAILQFLGLKPPEEKPSAGGDEDEL